MRILIIGNEGFIGGYLSKALMSKGHEVVGLDIFANDTDGKCHFYPGPIPYEFRILYLLAQAFSSSLQGSFITPKMCDEFISAVARNDITGAGRLV